VADSLIAWTARAAIGCCIVRLLLIGRRCGPIATRSEIAIWAAGWMLLLMHTVLAFQFQHHWSHAAAYAHTARRTLETAGWDWGGGVYFNYLTLVLWGADVVVLSIATMQQRASPRWWSWPVIGWIGFIVVNSTLVFGPRWWWGVAALVLIVIAIQRSLVRRAPE